MKTACRFDAKTKVLFEFFFAARALRWDLMRLLNQLPQNLRVATGALNRDTG
jgi:hypothetical protein